MDETKNIKDYRDHELKSYVIGNLLIILLLSGTFDEIMAKDINSFASAFSTVVNILITSSISYIFVFLMDSVIPGDVKFSIVYFPFGELPGKTIFSKMKNDCKDMRFTEAEVLFQYKDIYTTLPEKQKDRKKYENSKWNNLYRKYEKKSRVFVANRDFLLCRDMTIMTAFLLGIYLLGIYGIQIFGFSRRIIAILIVEYIICNIATREKGKKFAYNVIAEDIFASQNKD